MQDIFSKILELTNYQGDREAWVEEAFMAINLNAFNVLIQSLPSEKQTEIQERLKKDIQNAPQILSEFVSTEQIKEAVELESEEFMKKYLEKVFPTLPPGQKKAIEDFFNSTSSEN
ncbi:MAG TPA: hypothetical protein VG965_01630 [Patescibacteria group bacterium]|nr:hypothetical protein [Patescibacteria group bacterium]